MTINPNAFPFVQGCKGAAIALSLLVSAATAGAADSPFTNLGGSWSGPGVITLATGTKERIRCRATYNVDRSGDNLNIAIRCASDSYKFNLQGNITHSRGAVTGV